MRQVVTAKDLQCYFGKKPSMSFKMIRQIKKDLGKQNHQPITITEFCQYYKVDKEGIIEIIKMIENNKENNRKESANLDIEEQTSPITMPKNPKTNQNQPYCFSKKSW
jgi:hypothetical protein